MNTEYFFHRYPHLRRQDVTKEEFYTELDKLPPLSLFDLIADTDLSILDMVKECLVDCWWDDRSRL